jgi:hypothetical protein
MPAGDDDEDMLINMDGGMGGGHDDGGFDNMQDDY